MKNKLSLLMVAALVGNVQAVDSGQNAPLDQFENQLVTAWWNNPDLARDIRRIKEFHKVKEKDQDKIANLSLQTVTGFVDPTLGKIAPGTLQQILKQINFAFEQHDGKYQLPVAFMKKGDTVVAAYISDTRTPDVPFPQASTYDLHVNTLIENLRNQHGANLPILVNTPNRNPRFFGVTGTLYSSAKEIDGQDSHDLEIDVQDSHDLTMHCGTGATVRVWNPKGDLKGDLRINANRVTIHNPINLNLTCDNKEATIMIWNLEPRGLRPGEPRGWPEGYTGIVTLNDHQGRVRVWGDKLTLKMKNHSDGVEICAKAKAIIENAKIESLSPSNGDVLIVNGTIRDAKFMTGSTVWLVDSTVHSSKTYGSEPDIYPIDTKGDLSKAPGMLEKMLKDKEGSDADKQKTMNSFNELWNQRQMTNEDSSNNPILGKRTRSDQEVDHDPDKRQRT